jgi:hypothetical protein
MVSGRRILPMLSMIRKISLFTKGGMTTGPAIYIFFRRQTILPQVLPRNLICLIPNGHGACQIPGDGGGRGELRLIPTRILILILTTTTTRITIRTRLLRLALHLASSLLFLPKFPVAVGKDE